MTISVKTGSFVTSTGAISPPLYQSVTGLGFQPKALIFKLSQNRSLDDTHVFNGALQSIGFGFSAGAGKNTFWCGDAFATIQRRANRSALSCIYARDTILSILETRAAVTSLDADGFTILFSLADYAARIDYIAIGGDGVTGVEVFQFDDRTSAGNHAITGLGITPKLVVFGDAWTNNTAEFDDYASPSSIRPQLSFLTASASASMVTAISPLNPAGSTLATSLRTDNIALVYAQISSTTPMSLATLVSMDAGGFTLNYSTAFASTTRRCGIAIAGDFDVACGSVTEPLSVGSVDVAVPFRPKGGLLMSQGRAATTVVNGGTASAIEVDPSWGLWSNDGGHYTTAWSAFRDASNAWMSGKTQDDTFEVLDQTGAGTAGTVSRFSLDGSLSGNANFNFDVVTGAGIDVAYMLFGDTPGTSQATRSTRRRLAPA